MKSRTTRAARAPQPSSADGPSPATATSRRTGPLRGREIAEAAALGDVVAVMCLLAQVFPVAGGLAFAACFPMALVGMRHRLRVVVLAIFVAGCIGFLLGGAATVTMAVPVGLVGAPVGIGFRRHWSLPRLAGVVFAFWAIPVAALALGVLAVLSGYRQLAFDGIKVGISSLQRIAGLVGLDGLGDRVHRGVDTALDWWPLTVSVSIIVALTLACVVVRYTFGFALALARKHLPATDSLLPETTTAAPAGPLPLRLRDIVVRYRGRTDPALEVAAFHLDPAELVAVVGPNGAGKSTLARVVAGSSPTSGDVQRPGAAGLGAYGGTSIIFQRPESQVLGVRVVDDLRWGSGVPADLDVSALLTRVGLAGLESRETSTLSGGQLQRLAIAAGLARDPAVLVSDESTSMLDADGRAAVLDIYRRAADSGTAVVHVTHHEPEAEASDRTVVVTSARGAADSIAVAPPYPGPPSDTKRGGAIALTGVDLVRDQGTPWELPVLHNVNLDIPAGAAVGIVGHNGSGKSTLAWMLAGLLAPTAGTVTVDGAPVKNGRGNTLIGVQAARLHLVGPTVSEDIVSASGASEFEMATALRRVGLDPQTFSERAVGELSGGEQRRVVLAGLIAAQPRVLILDEPLAGLDAAAIDAMVTALHQIRSLGTTLIVVTHDLGPLQEVLDRVYEVHDHQVYPLPSDPLTAQSAESTTQKSSRRHRPALASVLGRTLPQHTPARGIWVGTKLLTLAAIGIVAGLWTTWPVIGAAALLLVGWFLLAGVPWRCIPRMPRFFGVLTVISLIISLIGTTKPALSVLGLSLSIGGLDVFARTFATTMVSLAAALLFCWTTPLGDIPAFMQTVSTFAARLRIPLTSVTVAVALGIRLGPLVVAEVQAMWQLLGQRREMIEIRGELRRRPLQIADLVALLMLTCGQGCRRAGELADAMTARGGIGAIASPADPPRLRDFAVLCITAAVLTGGVLLELWL